MFPFAKEIQLWAPLYYGEFVWSQKYQKSYIPYLYNTDTSVKRTLGSVPLVSVLKRFDCITCADVPNDCSQKVSQYFANLRSSVFTLGFDFLCACRQSTCMVEF